MAFTAEPAAGSDPGSAAGDRRRDDLSPNVWHRSIREGLLLAALWMVYTLGRGLSGRHTGPAFSNSSDIWRLERWMRLPSEASLQHWALHWEPGIRAANLHYKYVHFTAFVLVCIWLVVWHPRTFRWFRRVLVFITGLALVGHFVYPLAPPRMRPDLDIVDTAQAYGHAVYGNTYDNHGLLSQYAAMPSMHIGWAFLFALLVVSVARTPWRWIILAHPLLMTYTVVVTGNHYWLDGIIALVILAVGLATFRRGSPLPDLTWTWRAARP